MAIQLYTSPDGVVSIDTRVDNETIWLSEQQMATLFGVDRSVISRHISKIYKELELARESNVQKMHIPFSDKLVKFYDMDIIIGV